MSNIQYTTSVTDQELMAIINLQKENLRTSLTPEEVNSQGFVTVVHSYKDLKKLNEIEHHIIAKDGETIAAYLLAMTALSKSDIPILEPMFKMFDDVPFAGKTVSDFRYIVVGQVCVNKIYRSMGILDKCYNFYKEVLQPKYDFAITEIAVSNERSLRAHKRVGFKDAYRYADPDGVEWVIVIWDWNNIEG